MSFMENVLPRGKSDILYVVKNIPSAAQHAFGGKAQVWKSLRTTDKFEAATKAIPILAALEAQIAGAIAAPAAVVLAPAPIANQRLPIHPDRARTAFETWRLKSIEAAWLDAFNGIDSGFPLQGDHARMLSLRRLALKERRTDDIEDFDAKLVAVLNEQGVPSDIDHPALKNLRREFAAAWFDVEEWQEEFRWGRLDGWPEDEAEGETGQPVAPPLSLVKPESRLSVLELYDRWSPVAAIKLEARNRGYVQRLSEFLGPKAIGDIEPHDIASFKVEALKFPMTKRPDILALPFGDVLAWAEGEGAATPRTDPATIWKWLNTINGMFGYALKNRWIEVNPADGVMAKPGKKRNARLPFDDADIREIFSAPMFTGFQGRADVGYRDKPGTNVVKDAKYWLPIVALFTGARLEEIGSTLASEVRQQDGVWFFDILERGEEEEGDQRSIKNDQSRRVVPLHQKLIDLGFLAYVKGLPADGYLFPDLKPSQTPYGVKRTPGFSKWWSLFCAANAKVKGQGMDAPKKPFYAFRHAAIRALRKDGVNPVLAYMLAGHEDGEIDAMNLNYGKGADLKNLKATIDQIEFPTFPF